MQMSTMHTAYSTTIHHSSNAASTMVCGSSPVPPLTEPGTMVNWMRWKTRNAATMMPPQRMVREE